MTSSDVQDPSIQIPALQMCENKFGTHQNMEFRRATIVIIAIMHGMYSQKRFASMCFMMCDNMCAMI